MDRIITLIAAKGVDIRRNSAPTSQAKKKAKNTHAWNRERAAKRPSRAKGGKRDTRPEGEGTIHSSGGKDVQPPQKRYKPPPMKHAAGGPNTFARATRGAGRADAMPQGVVGRAGAAQ